MFNYSGAISPEYSSQRETAVPTGACLYSCGHSYRGLLSLIPEILHCHLCCFPYAVAVVAESILICSYAAADAWLVPAAMAFMVDAAAGLAAVFLASPFNAASAKETACGQ